MFAVKNAATLLLLIAPLFSRLAEAEYEQLRRSAAWREVRAQKVALGSVPKLSAWIQRRSMQDELLVAGMPLAVMPVESLYKEWSCQTGNAYGAFRGLYLGDPARHLRDVYDRLGIEVPEAFASMPDHLTLEVELLVLLLEAGNDAAACQLAHDHLDWLDDYDAALGARSEAVAHQDSLEATRRENVREGIGCLRALVALVKQLVLVIVSEGGEGVSEAPLSVVLSEAGEVGAVDGSRH